MVFDQDPDYLDSPEGRREIIEYTDAVQDKLILAASNLNAIEYEFITLLREFDYRECWYGTGAKSSAHWLNWKCGLSPVVAREKVRVARTLRDLPQIDEAFRVGRISYSKVRALTRAATPENETLLLDRAVRTTAAHLERMVARYKLTCQWTPRPDQLQPRFSCERDEYGVVHLNVKLPAEDGALVERAVERMVNRMRLEASEIDDGERHDGGDEDEAHGDPGDGDPCGTKKCGPQREKVSAEAFLRERAQVFAGQRVTALARIAENYLAMPPEGEEKSLRGSDKTHLVLHVNVNDRHPDARISGGLSCYLREGQFISPQVAQRLACDAAVTTVLEDDDGKVRHVGGRSRTIPRDVGLAVDIRDNYTCQFPNCHEHRYTDKHHVVHWAHGGPTTVPNLITLCRYHHTRVHERCFYIKRVGDGFVFYDHRGKRIERGMDPQFPIARPVLPAVLPPAKTADERRQEQILALQLYGELIGSGVESRGQSRAASGQHDTDSSAPPSSRDGTAASTQTRQPAARSRTSAATR